MFRLNLLLTTDSAFNRQVLEGVGDYVKTSHIQWNTQALSVAPPLDDMNSWKGDAMIVGSDFPNIKDYIRSSDIPAVLVSNTYPENQRLFKLPSVSSDRRTATLTALRHLQSKGLSNIAFLGSHKIENGRWVSEPEHSLVSATTNEVHIFIPRHNEHSHWHKYQQDLYGWLQKLPKPIGIITESHAHARYLIEACKELKMVIPDQVSVASTDYDEVEQSLMSIPVTAVKPSARKIGYEAVSMIQELLTTQKLKTNHMTVPPQPLIGNQSTNHECSCDPYVKQAIDFIQRYACKGIKVAQVVEYVGISRSNLERRFFEETHCSIHDLLHDTKFLKAKELLSQSDLSIDDISHLCGYSTVQYLYFVFKKSLNTTPAAFRREHN